MHFIPAPAVGADVAETESRWAYAPFETASREARRGGLVAVPVKDVTGELLLQAVEDADGGFAQAFPDAVSCGGVFVASDLMLEVLSGGDSVLRGEAHGLEGGCEQSVRDVAVRAVGEMGGGQGCGLEEGTREDGLEKGVRIRSGDGRDAGEDLEEDCA